MRIEVMKGERENYKVKLGVSMGQGLTQLHRDSPFQVRIGGRATIKVSLTIGIRTLRFIAP